MKCISADAGINGAAAGGERANCGKVAAAAEIMEKAAAAAGVMEKSRQRRRNGKSRGSGGSNGKSCGNAGIMAKEESCLANAKRRCAGRGQWIPKRERIHGRERIWLWKGYESFWSDISMRI